MSAADFASVFGRRRGRSIELSDELRAAAESVIGHEPFGGVRANVHVVTPDGTNPDTQPASVLELDGHPLLFTNGTMMFACPDVPLDEEQQALTELCERVAVAHGYDPRVRALPEQALAKLHADLSS